MVSNPLPINDTLVTKFCKFIKRHPFNRAKLSEFQKHVFKSNGKSPTWESARHHTNTCLSYWSQNGRVDSGACPSVSWTHPQTSRAREAPLPHEHGQRSWMAAQIETARGCTSRACKIRWKSPTRDRRRGPTFHCQLVHLTERTKTEIGFDLCSNKRRPFFFDRRGHFLRQIICQVLSIYVKRGCNLWKPC